MHGGVVGREVEAERVELPVQRAFGADGEAGDSQLVFQPARQFAHLEALECNAELLQLILNFAILVSYVEID